MERDATILEVPPSTRRSTKRSWPGVLRWSFALLLLLVLSGSLGLLGTFLFRPDIGEELTVGLAPPQYYAEFDPEKRIYSDSQYQSVWTVAHNSGGDLRAVVESLLYSADIIEMDVVEIDGVLYSAHNPPIPFLDHRWFRGPRVDMVWAASGSARGFMLDLKQTDREYVELVATFINSRPSTRPFFVASRDPNVLRQIRMQAPEAVLLMSVPDLGSLNDFLASDSLVRLVDGVTLRQSVIDEETAARLNADDLMIFAWVVNDLGRVNELIELGVDGITSDNLAILQLLGGKSIPEAETNPGGPPPDDPDATPEASPSASPTA